jgi:hypothetical protein
MRKTLIALMVTMPIAAFAQTPRDLASLTWPHGAPSSTSAAPATYGQVAGGFTAADLTRLAPLSRVAAPGVRAPQGAVYVSGFTPSDLARLRDTPAGSFMTGAPAASPSYLAVAR